MKLTFIQMAKVLAVVGFVVGCSPPKTSFSSTDPSLMQAGIGNDGTDVIDPPPSEEPPIVVDEPPVVVEPPPVEEPPVVVEPPPVEEPPVVVEPPPVEEPPIVDEPPVDNPPICVITRDEFELRKAKQRKIKIGCGHSIFKKIDAQSVFINVKHIELGMTFEGKKSRVIVGENTGLVDLLHLQDEQLVPMQDARVPVGATIESIRLVLFDTNNYVVRGDRSRCEMKTPSAQQSGVKIHIKGGIPIEENSTYTVKLDFDVDRSIVVTGKNDCLLKPVIKMLSFTKTTEDCDDDEGEDQHQDNHHDCKKDDHHHGHRKEKRPKHHEYSRGECSGGWDKDDNREVWRGGKSR